MAPELSDGGATMSVATDVFSFGMLMRQVLHPGDPQPFGTNAMVIMRRLDKGERPAFTRADAPQTTTVAMTEPRASQTGTAAAESRSSHSPIATA